MTEPLYFTRAKLRREVPAAALRELLLPDDHGRRAGAGHRLVWTLFADSPDRRRDFLWRETDAGTFLLLSQRPPADAHGLFDIDPPKSFAPALSSGDRLAYSLRANATTAKSRGHGQRGKPVDVVMNAIHAIAPGERAAHRTEAVAREGRHWLERQGEAHGFSLLAGEDGVRVSDYRTLRVDHAGPTARVGVLDLDGTLEVREPALFVRALAQGFGRAKAFGCGLMLVRRARSM